jgi:DNA (cytosine-5)-methyltransferase 1
MRFGSVCSGIEAASVAWQPLGWKAAWLSEVDPFANAVLAHRYPDVPNLGDMTKLGEKEEYRGSEIDILIGGTPCQSFSVAGFRKGLRDKRGGLALTFCEIAREKRPRWVVWENVPGVLSSNKGRDFGSILGALAECGYGLAYRVLDAQYFGVPQRRRRVFVVGHRGDYRAQQVLFDSKGGPWDAPPRQECPEPRPIPVKVPENHSIGIEPSTEASRCLLASGTGRNIWAETFLIDSNEWDDCVDVIQFGDPADHDPPVVRKLMPLEWERLMGFPDDYTLVRYRGPAELCPDAPRYKALGNSIVVPVLRWIGERIAMVDALPTAELVHPEDLAKTLSDSELVEKCVQGFRDLREALPYLREARDRFAQPGRRVPVPGNPTWTEWVETNLHRTVRRVQQLLSEGPGPRETISPGSKRPPGKLRTGDWRGLLKVTGRRNAQVFGSVEDPKRLAGTIRDFAQGIADRYAQPSGKLVVSVSVKTRK